MWYDEPFAHKEPRMNIGNQWITFIHKRLNLPFKQVMVTFFATFIIGFFAMDFS